MTISLRKQAGIVIVIAISVLLFAQEVSAQGSGVDFRDVTSGSQSNSTIADIQCLPEAGSCQYRQCCKQLRDPNQKCTKPEEYGVVGKPCKDPRGVDGHCTAFKICKADSFTNSTGGRQGVGDMSQFMSMLSQLMKGLGGGGGGGGSGGSGSGGSGGTGSTGGYTGSQGCSQYYQVSTPSSDPCAYYVPSSTGTGSSINLNIGGSGSGNTNNSVSDILNGGSTGNTNNTNGNTNTNTNTNNNNTTDEDTSNSNPISDLLNTFFGNNNDDNQDTNGASTGTSSGGNTGGGVSSSTSQGATNLGQGGAQGEIRVLPNGVTIVVSNQNGSNNSVTAGFLGTQTSGGAQPTGLAASWCRTRPWASNFLSFIIPATFFDSLCTLRGYQVGQSQQSGSTGSAQIGSTVQIHNPPAQPVIRASTTASTTTVPMSPPMQVRIWAVPATVPLGGRTTVYWNSRNAASCVETSPDGSFSQSTLSGGGATVPLSGPTTFTISCVAPDGTHATDDIIVKLSL